MHIEIYESWERRIKEILLEEGEIPITTLTKLLGTSLPTAQKYTLIMELKGLLQSKVAGRNRFVRLK